MLQAYVEPDNLSTRTFQDSRRPYCTLNYQALVSYLLCLKTIDLLVYLSKFS
jgi:hypothetical protein